MADIKLIGTDTIGDTDVGPNYVHACQFICGISGVVSLMAIYPRVDSNVRVAMYTDSGSNTVGTLIAESANTPITTGAWRYVSCAAGAITAGIKYWLAIQVETSGGAAYIITGVAPRGYKNQAYGAFPANGSGFSHDAGVLYSLQGWGTPLAVPRSFGFIIG